MNYYKQLFATLLSNYIPELSVSELIELIEQPPSGLGADLAFPSFVLAKSRKSAPAQIATRILEDITSTDLGELSATGPYINLTLDPSFVLQSFQTGISKDNTTTHDKLILIESPSPNTNKPLHLGHVRNMVLGNVLDRTLRAEGYNTKKVEVVNDRGIHICKSMLAYKLRGNNQEPDCKGDHFVGKRYVRYAQELESDPTLEQQAQDMLRAWESGDKEVRVLREKMNGRALEGMRETYERYHTHIDDATYESDVYLAGKSLAHSGLEEGVFVKDPKGNIAFPIQEKDGETSYFVVLRSDETSVYATQDIALVDKRFKTYDMDKMVYIVGDEQKAYFSTLFEVFKALKYPFAEQCFHLSYGMIELPEGKMKSRTGNVIDADDLIQSLHDLSYEEIARRFPDLDDEQIHKRAEQIALGAINFFMIKIDAKKGFVFDPESSLSFEGETGPYLQYTYARINSLVNNYTKTFDQEFVSSINLELKQGSEELQDIKSLLLQLSQLGEIIQEVNAEYKPHILARYALDIAQDINSYYQAYRIIDVDQHDLSQSRLSLLLEAQDILRQTMNLVGVPVIDAM